MLGIGVDLGGNKIEVAALDADRRMLDWHRIAAPAGDYGAILAAIVALVHETERASARP